LFSANNSFIDFFDWSLEKINTPVSGMTIIHTNVTNRKQKYNKNKGNNDGLMTLSHKHHF